MAHRLDTPAHRLATARPHQDRLHMVEAVRRAHLPATARRLPACHRRRALRTAVRRQVMEPPPRITKGRRPDTSSRLLGTERKAMFDFDGIPCLPRGIVSVAEGDAEDA